MSDEVDDFVRAIDRIACETMALRDWMDQRAFYVEVFTTKDPSPWRDAARIVIEDLLTHAPDGNALLTRVRAWETIVWGKDE